MEKDMWEEGAHLAEWSDSSSAVTRCKTRQVQFGLRRAALHINFNYTILTSLYALKQVLSSQTEPLVAALNYTSMI